MNTSGPTGESSDGDAVIITMFPGWAESELWYDGPIAYPDSLLPVDLIGRLEAWAKEHYARVRANMNEGLPDSSGELRPQAALLAREVAEQLGPGFAVEVDHPDGRDTLLVRTQGPPRRPEAAAALNALVRERDQRRQLREQIVAESAANGVMLRWAADRPDTRGPDSDTKDVFRVDQLTLHTARGSLGDSPSHTIEP